MIKLLHYYYYYFIEKNAEFINVECVSKNLSKSQTNKNIVMILIEYVKNNTRNKTYILTYKVLTKKTCYLKILNEKNITALNMLIYQLMNCLEIIIKSKFI